MTNEEVRACARAIGLTETDIVKLGEAIRGIRDALLTTCGGLIKAIAAFWRDAVDALEGLKKRGVFNYEPTARKKKRERERRLSIKRINAVRFSTYCRVSVCWSKKRRMRPRARGRGPPACEGRDISGKG